MFIDVCSALQPQFLLFIVSSVLVLAFVCVFDLGERPFLVYVSYSNVTFLLLYFPIRYEFPGPSWSL